MNTDSDISGKVYCRGCQLPPPSLSDSGIFQYTVGTMFSHKGQEYYRALSSYEHIRVFQYSDDFTAACAGMHPPLHSFHFYVHVNL